MIDFFQTLGIKTFVFVDCENAETSSPKLLFEFLKEKDLLNLSTQIICFIGAKNNQNKFYEDFANLIQSKKISCNIFPIRVKTIAKDALDKVLIAYLGMLMARKPDAEFVIVSADSGYETVVKHFTELGIDVNRESVPKPEEAIAKKKTNSKRTSGKKVMLDNAGAKVKSATTTETKKTELNKTKETDVLVDTNIETAITKIIQLPKNKRPKKINTLKNKIGNDNQNLTIEQIDLVVETLKNKYNMSVDPNGKITWK